MTAIWPSIDASKPERPKAQKQMWFPSPSQKGKHVTSHSRQTLSSVKAFAGGPQGEVLNFALPSTAPCQIVKPQELTALMHRSLSKLPASVLEVYFHFANKSVSCPPTLWIFYFTESEMSHPENWGTSGTPQLLATGWAKFFAKCIDPSVMNQVTGFLWASQVQITSRQGIVLPLADLGPYVPNSYGHDW
jgi:hypothetical protein